MNEMVCQENPTATNMSRTIKQEQQDSHSTQTNYEVPYVIIVNILNYFYIISIKSLCLCLSFKP